MFGLRPLLCSLIASCLIAGSLSAQANRIFLFPSAGNPNVTVLDAATLSAAGTIVASQFAFQGTATPDGSKYYVFARDTMRTITSVSSSNLAAPTYINLSAAASAGVITPDGKKLLVTAGQLHIFDTATNNELFAPGLNVGPGPTDIEVTNDSKTAYVLSTNGSVISAVDLTQSPPAVTQISVSGALSIALTPDNKSLAVLLPGALDLINTKNNAVATSIPIPALISGKVLITPDSTRAIVVNQAGGPLNASQIVDLGSSTLKAIGTGNQGFDQIVIADNATAFGLVTGDHTVAKIVIDLSSPNAGQATVQSYGQNTRSMDISPNGKALYLMSSQNSSVTRVDVALNLPSPAAVTLPAVPTGITAIFPPPTTGAVSIALNGGDQQFVNAGQTSFIPLSVKVTDSTGAPVFNVPVTFATTATDVTFTPAQPSLTNSRGIAEAFVSIAAASALKEEASSSTAAEAASGPAVADGVTTINITATSPGVGTVTFTLTIGSGTGIIIISGNFQMTRPNQPFPEPLVVRVTDENGIPVPAGTVVNFQGGLGFVTTTTDNNGFAQATFNGRQLPPGSFFLADTINAYAADGNPSGSATFTLTTAFTLPTIGQTFNDQQSGPVGSTLPLPLVVQLTNTLGPVGPVTVYWSVVSGPSGAGSATFNPPASVAVGAAQTTVTLGPKAGTVQVQARIPETGGDAVAVFTLFATQPPPAQVTILQGNNQQGNPGVTLPTALVIKVTDQFGNPFPLPNATFPLSFNVNPVNAATLMNITQLSNGQASVQVKLGNTPGPFTITASIGSASATFNLRVLALPSSLVIVSGNNQQVSVGSTTAASIILRVNDSLGNGVAGVPVTITAPSGITLTPAQGTAGNPVTINSGSDGSVSFTAKASAGATLGQNTITAGFSQNGATGTVTVNLVVAGALPTFTAASIVNAASFAPGMVPYGLATLFGTGLSQVSGTEFPGGATIWKGVQVKIDGVAVPLFAISNQNGQEQINFQVRADLGVPAVVHVTVENNGSSTTVSNVPVLPAQPGIFEYTPQGGTTKYAAALKVDNSTMGPGNPVARGSYLQLYLTGLGPVLPNLQTGQAGLSTPPFSTTFYTPTVMIAGASAPVLFSGVAPGFVGLYQINIQVPASIQAGTVPLVVTVNGVSSQTTQVAVQ